MVLEISEGKLSFAEKEKLIKCTDVVEKKSTITKKCQLNLYKVKAEQIGKSECFPNTRFVQTGV